MDGYESEFSDISLDNPPITFPDKKKHSIMKDIRDAVKRDDVDTYRLLLQKHSDTTSEYTCICESCMTDTIYNMLSCLGFIEVKFYVIAFETGHITHCLYDEIGYTHTPENTSQMIHNMFRLFDVTIKNHTFYSQLYKNSDGDYGDEDDDEDNVDIDIDNGNVVGNVGNDNKITQEQYSTNVLTVIKFLLDKLGTYNIGEQNNCIQDFAWINMNIGSFRNSKRYIYGHAPKIIVENYISMLIKSDSLPLYSKLSQDLIYLLITEGVPIPDYIAFWKNTDIPYEHNKNYDPTEDETYKSILEYRTSFEHMISHGMVYLLKKLAYKEEYSCDIIKAFKNCDKYIEEFAGYMKHFKSQSQVYKKYYSDCDDILLELKRMKLNVDETGELF
jgi:hypothetical protein